MRDFPTAVTELIAAAPPTDLGPGTPAAERRAQIRTAVASLPPACGAGLWLLFDYLDESHTISQADESCPNRNFWHAIMHRREPDAWNSKYWWRRVGAHPVLAQLAEQAPAVGYKYTTPFDFVDFCEKARGTGGADEQTAQRVQRLEWDLLFAWCFDRDARK
ncbi:hypothetical protein R5W24_004069 [Gemmata sp. JC717]|uniref:hypothetical protein n=1 Tax=Gemmata algarum TaxID=2975278 RepID=UPI0021BAE5F2|nr:hypothetical protein [Gemmata algarum]MDY3554937.1 hypothetical protein [Gemmata algarum]